TARGPSRNALLQLDQESVPTDTCLLRAGILRSIAWSRSRLGTAPHRMLQCSEPPLPVSLKPRAQPKSARLPLSNTSAVKPRDVAKTSHPNSARRGRTSFENIVRLATVSS